MRIGRIGTFAALAALVAGLVVTDEAPAEPKPILSREQVRQVALDWNAGQESATGRIVAPMGVASISLGKEGSRFVWHVTYLGGTYVGCGGWWCNLYSGGGDISISDRPGDCSGNRDACERLSKDLVSRVTATSSSGKVNLGLIPLYQAMGRPATAAPQRSALEARKIALRYLNDNETALGEALSDLPSARVVSLARLQPGKVHIVDRRQGGFKAGPPTWVVRVRGTLANCIDDYPESKGYNRGVPTSYGTRQCTVATSGYLGIADHRAFPTAVILTGNLRTLPLTALSPSCELTRLERIIC